MRIFQFILAGIFSILLTGGCASTHSSRPAAIQIDLGKLLDARVVITQAGGHLQLADYSLDRDDSSVLITKSAAKISRAGQLNPLPDAGFFPADSRHPDVQLAYGIVGDGPQVHRSPDRGEIYSFAVPQNHYRQMQLFLISANGPTPIVVTLHYANGSSERRVAQVPDFYFLPKPTDKDWFVLAADFGKVNRKGLMTESVHHYIHGFDLNPDPVKVLQEIAVSKEDSKSVLNLFGTTGQLAE